MINIPVEAVLALAVAGLYLKDSACLLHSDEAVLTASHLGSRSPRWRAAFGARNWRLAGKEPWLPNPFTPQRAAWRLRWRMDGEQAPAAPAAGQALQARPALRRLAPFVWVAWVCLLVGVPVGLLSRAGPQLAIAAAGVAYVNAIVALALVWRWREALGLPPKAFGGLAFECLSCIPYSINLLRKVAAAHTPPEDFALAAQRLLPPAEWAAAQAQCLLRLDEQLDAEAEGSARSTALQAARARFGGGPAA